MGRFKEIRFHVRRQVMDDKARDMQQIEVSPFGAMSECGSCLFHWVNDTGLLYGVEKEVKVRLTTEDKRFLY